MTTMDVFQYEPWLTLLPVVHGSGSYATALREYVLKHPMDCLAVPLPPSFAEGVLNGVSKLPAVSAVVQTAAAGKDPDDRWIEEGPRRGTYVPIDPCQGVIAALRFSVAERIAIEWIDPESMEFHWKERDMPDAYAVEHTSLERFCSAMLPAIPPPAMYWHRDRLSHLAARLLGLQGHYERVLCLCHLRDWPWLRGAIEERKQVSSGKRSEWPGSEEDFKTCNYAIDPRTHLFLHGELPFVTGLYERARASLDDDAKLSVEGLKELFVAARSSYRADMGRRARHITPLLISQCLKYIRNQTLLGRRMTPSFYTIARSAQQMMGDTFTTHLVSVAKDYPYDESLPWPMMKMGIDQADLPDSGLTTMVSRLPGPPVEWQHLELNRPAGKQDKRKWSSRWNPYQQCSWPEEDTRIESFRNRIVERARGMIGADLARTEKFTTSMMDGLELRETLRHWYDGSLYVKVLPPSIGQLDATVMLFDGDADPREYSWRSTWFAEHGDESTLAFYATPFTREMLGPGVAVSTYGGAMFLYPPRPIEDIWADERLDFADTLEQRLVAAACLHAESRHIALLSHAAPGIVLKKIAKRFRRKLVHVPLGQFADSVVQQLRMFHVLNGKHVRSYAAHFIRKA
jgi:hypothetical protein